MQARSSSPDVPAPAREGVVRACLSAGATLTAIEVARWLGLRNYLAPSYYLLCVGLALAASLLLGLVAKGLLRLGRSRSGLERTRPLALALWAGVAGGLVAGPLPGLGVALGTWIALGLGAEGARPGAPLAGAAVGAALALVLLKGDWVADRVPGLPEAVSMALVGALLMAGVLRVVPLLAVRFHGPLRAAGWAAVPILLAAWFALEPWTQRASGSHRRPPERFAERRQAPTAAHPDVLLIVLDTLRADRLSVYGYERETTPELARWMQRRPNAVAFPAAYSNGTWTVPSHASLFTGLLPNGHGAHFDLDGSLRTQFGMHANTPRLATALQEQGYATLGVYANYWLRIVEGMRDGFDLFFRVIHFERLPFLGEALRELLVPGVELDVTKGGSRGAMVNRSLLDLARGWHAGVENPLFLFANYGDTHGPYVPPEPYRGTFHPASLRERPEHVSVDMSDATRERLSARYDEELLYLDHQLGDLFEELDALGFLGGAWVFITSDHGEAFAEHGVTEHGTTVHEEVVRVPLLVFPPDGVQLTATDAPVSLVDVSATIAALAGTKLPGSPGRDLRSLDPASAVAGIEFYGDALKARQHGPLAALPQRSVRKGSWKLVVRGADDDSEVLLFDLASPEAERRDVAAEHPDVVADLQRLLTTFGEPARGNTRVSAAEQKRLEDMGYVGDHEAAPSAEASSERDGPGPGPGGGPDVP